MDAFERLVALVARLRGPDGCAWDRAQTPASMRAYLVEETYEVLDAIDQENAQALAGELGDLLFLVALLARMHEEQGAFDLAACADRVITKMVRRHPHLFGEATERPGWETLKLKEGRTSLLEGIPAALPALLRAQRIGERAAEVGFDWPDAKGVRSKLDEELTELDAAVAARDPQAIADELGDVLFTLAQLARHHGLRAEDVLRAGTSKFERRFRSVERIAASEGRALAGTPASTLDGWWRRAKEEA